jgi:hypothetical protein
LGSIHDLDDDQFSAEIIALATQYNLISKFSSFSLVEKKKQSTEQTMEKIEILASQLPESVRVESNITAQLSETLEVLETRERFLQNKADSLAQLAKMAAKDNNQEALKLLKQKRVYESQLEKISNSRMTIEQQTMTLESATVSLEAMKAMRRGANSMRTVHSSMQM